MLINRLRKGETGTLRPQAMLGAIGGARLGSGPMASPWSFCGPAPREIARRDRDHCIICCGDHSRLPGFSSSGRGRRRRWNGLGGLAGKALGVAGHAAARERLQARGGPGGSRRCDYTSLIWGRCCSAMSSFFDEMPEAVYFRRRRGPDHSSAPSMPRGDEQRDCS